MIKRSILTSMAAALLVVAMVAPAHARDGERGDRGDRGDRGGHVERPGGHGSYLDSRYHHDHYYPSRGYVFHEPPHDSVVVNHFNHRYWYGGGVWYEPRGPRWVVVGPPIGVFVPILPPFYTTVWFGGLPYYYANDAYYVWRERERSYEVVDPPSEANAATEAPPAEDIFMYPRNGQDAQRQATDRYECHRWAADQTGFDPTRPAGGVGSTEAGARRGEYFRAMAACLEGRGYSVK